LNSYFLNFARDFHLATISSASHPRGSPLDANGSRCHEYPVASIRSPDARAGAPEHTEADLMPRTPGRGSFLHTRPGAMLGELGAEGVAPVCRTPCRGARGTCIAHGRRRID